MPRRPNSTSTGGSFPQQIIVAVWRKGRIVQGYDPSRLRQDVCGAWMEWAHYGNTNSARGWEIDHVKPVSKAGVDHLSNLQPLNWKNNRHKGDSYPNWGCAVP